MFHDLKILLEKDKEAPPCPLISTCDQLRDTNEVRNEGTEERRYEKAREVFT
jgi:hypothetical protein